MSNLVSPKFRIAKEKPSKFSYQKLGKGQNMVVVTVSGLQNHSTILTAARKIQPEVFFMNESLVPSRQKLLYELLKMKRDHHCFHSGFSF